MPLAFSASPILRLSLGLMVLASATTVPGLAPWMTPSLAEDHFLGHLGVADAEEDAIGIGRDLGRRVASLALFFGRQFARLFAGVRPERDLVAGAQQVAGHGVAHRPESKKA